MPQQFYEVNFDGIVGPTHNYSGLSYGNTASEVNQFQRSNPREAALQGLKKMKFLADKGIKQAILPPQERPFLPLLRKIGFSGSDQEILKSAYHYSPDLLLAVCSAASMWTANAATVSPSIDSQDGRLHLTPANLSNKLHRSIETETTARILRMIFPNPRHFIHHDPLPSGTYFADEGAANHLRFCQNHGEKGIQVFVYGRSVFKQTEHSPVRYPARQTKEACEALVRLHQLNPNRVMLIQQHPDAIDAGAFHNDVVSVGNQNVFLLHEKAFFNQEMIKRELEEKMAAACGISPTFLEVKSEEISLEEAISSYLFNSQLLSLPKGKMALVAPLECQENQKIASYIQGLVSSSENPIQEAYYFDLRQSMRNGGGPACLRLKIVMTQQELEAAHQGVFLNETLYLKLKNWIHRYYRDRLDIQDLADPQLLKESREALHALSEILGLPL